MNVLFDDEGENDNDETGDDDSELMRGAHDD